MKTTSKAVALIAASIITCSGVITASALSNISKSEKGNNSIESSGIKAEIIKGGEELGITETGSSAWMGGGSRSFRLQRDTKSDATRVDWQVKLTLAQGIHAIDYWRTDADKVEKKENNTYIITPQASYRKDFWGTSPQEFGFGWSGYIDPSPDPSPDPAPQLPTNVVVSDVTAHTATLNWNAPSGKVESFNIYQENDKLDNVPGNKTNYPIKNLEADTKYTFYISSLAGNKESKKVKITFTTAKEDNDDKKPIPFYPYIDATLESDGPTNDLKASKENFLKWIEHADGVTFGFINGDKNGEASWSGKPLDDCHKQDGPRTCDKIKYTKEAGKKAIISFGGANGGELATKHADNPTALKEEYKKSIDFTGVYDLDFDIEGSEIGNVKANKTRAQVIKELQKEYGDKLRISFTLPVDIDGLSWMGQDLTSTLIEHGVTVDTWNLMTMEMRKDETAPYRSEAEKVKKSTEFFVKQVKEIHNKNHKKFNEKEFWKKLGITPMNGKNNGPYTFTQADAREVLTWAGENTDTRSPVAMLSMWSVSRDVMCPGGGTYADPTCSGISQYKHEFSEIFSGTKK